MGRKGFTLTELMIVIAVIGILAAIAIPNFLTFRLKVKVSEAKSNLGAIRTLEEAYFVEEERYYGPISQYPATPPDSGKEPWISGESGFSVLGFEPAGAVYFRYSIDFSSLITNPRWSGILSFLFNFNFIANAYGDLDGDGIQSHFWIDRSWDIRQSTAYNVY